MAHLEWANPLAKTLKSPKASYATREPLDRAVRILIFDQFFPQSSEFSFVQPARLMPELHRKYQSIMVALIIQGAFHSSKKFVTLETKANDTKFSLEVSKKPQFDEFP